MRKIVIKTWKAKMPLRDGDGKITGYEEQDENLLVAISVLLGNKKAENMPRGLDKFRLFNRLSKAFEKAEKKGVLELEEFDYKFLKDTIESDVPSIWGLNNNLCEAIEEFLNSPEIK